MLDRWSRFGYHRCMFVRAVEKRNPGSPTTYTYHRLMESYRTSRGPRQRTILNLGRLDLPKQEWKLLAGRIEEILSGQLPLQPVAERIERLAGHYAPLVEQRDRRRETPAVEQEQPEYRRVDLKSVEQHRGRTIGAEYVSLAYLRKLGMQRIFAEVGLSVSETQIAELLVIARLVHPGSERATGVWAEHASGVGELIGAQVKKLSHNALYRVSDRLYENKEQIEGLLRDKENGLFGLEEKVILYDLTNTYFEGTGLQCDELQHGRSKEKRTDCPLMTVGLVIDEWGFAKHSEFFPGKVSEPGTLEVMLGKLGALKGATVVIDAGIGTADNLAMLREAGYHYVTVGRGPAIAGDVDLAEGAVQIKAEGNNRVTGKLIKGESEWVLVCHSEQREAKEQAMAAGFRRRFEAGLEMLRSSLTKKRGHKSYEQVLQRIGRLKERSHGIHQYYDIQIDRNGEVVTEIRYSYAQSERAEQRYSGRYYIRTSRSDLQETELWQLYITLTGVEDSFRSLKSELGLRPVYHRVERRIKGHLFITLLAYHVLNAIRHNLRTAGYRMRWSTLRDRLSTHIISTVTMNTEEGKRVHIRSTSRPEVFHRNIYRALGLGAGPLRRRMTES